MQVRVDACMFVWDCEKKCVPVNNVCERVCCVGVCLCVGVCVCVWQIGKG